MKKQYDWKAIAIEVSRKDPARNVSLLGAYSASYCYQVYKRGNGCNNRLRKLILEVMRKYKAPLVNEIEQLTEKL